VTRRRYRTSIPADAVEVVEQTYPGRAKKSSYFLVGGEKVGYRCWDEYGRLEYEYGMRGGVKHGNEYVFWDGRVCEVQPYRRGAMHGTGRQWSADGRLLVTWRLARNAGMDLWCGHVNETLSEEHFWPRPGERGYFRQWNDDERTVWQEYWYVLGKGYHGVWREWNARGRLRRGFPHFYVNDKRVTKRQYSTACAADPSLLPYRPEEDDPHRKLPAEYLAQRPRE
jgi:hypothetical protein